jgi:PPK2 family polyphosphate:nucleotide phosphotransferase
VAAGAHTENTVTDGKRRRTGDPRQREVAVAKKAKQSAKARVSDLLRLPTGPVDLRSVDSAATPGLSHGKKRAVEDQAKQGVRLAELQERLYAEGRTGGSRSVLLLLQGMDTSGKGGTMRHVVGQVDPQGVRIASFKAPTAEEKEHDFLWRIRQQLPKPGHLGVFDRSHYEDVLIVRVRDLVPRTTWSRRFRTINSFEARLAETGTTLVKCFLHISKEEQRARLLARLDDPSKHWKFNPGDIDERAHWDAYVEAYADVLTRCNTDKAPWFVVPADRKWYRNWAITRLLVEQLEGLSLSWPVADFDVKAERKRLLAGD